MKIRPLALALVLLPMSLSAAAWVPPMSGTSVPCAETAARRDKKVPARELAKYIASASADMAALNKMKAAADAPKSNVIVVGKGTKASDTPDGRVRDAIAQFDLVAAYAASLSQDKLAAAAKQVKAALEANKLDDANTAWAEVKALHAHKK